MDYTKLMNDASGKKSLIGIVGAAGGFGMTLLSTLPRVDLVKLRVICDVDAQACLSVLKEVGFQDANIVICNNEDDIKAAPSDALLVVTDYKLVPLCGITSLIESTGVASVSSDAALRALRAGINVYMVSKETDSVCGTYFSQVAKENNAIYALVNGDQPRNLVDLVSWGKILGLDIIACGKSSEYDFVWNRETGDFTYTDGSNKFVPMPEMIDCWRFNGVETLAKRRELCKDYCEVISADLCEMNLVSNITGYVPSSPFLSYPICKPSELANVFIPKEDGGILERTGVVDVFYNLRETAEASFCGGEFIIIRCEHKPTWEILAGKGHVMSDNGKYCCIYEPYHYMGLETPVSIILGDLMGVGAHPECRQVSILGGVADEDIPAGTTLIVHGHHHQIDHLIPELLVTEEAGRVAPFYLLNGTTLKNTVKKGQPVTLDDVDLSASPLYDSFLKGLEIK